MTTNPSGCPSASSLEAVAGGAPASDELGAHVARCRECAEYLEAARFARRFASVVGGGEPRGVPGGPGGARGAGAGKPDVPGYRVLKELARGGQGVVYSGEQVATGQRVAIKVLHQSVWWMGASGVARSRFLREVRIVASLSHPGIVRPLDALRLVDGRDALIMEFVDGVSLDAWASDRPGPSRRSVLRLLASVGESLHHAHQRGVIHCDLKPSNILVDAEARPHVLDFGVARWTEGPGVRDRVTLTGEFVGTLAYAAPEQVSAVKSGPDVRTDVYALGVIGYQALTGVLPYGVDAGLEATIHNIMAAPTPRATRTVLDTDVWTVLAKAMAKEPARRYQSIADLARDLRRAAAGEAIDARRDSRWYVARKTARRHRLAVSVGVALLLGLLGVLGVLARGNARLTEALRVGTLHQVHAHTAAGARARAEALLWPAMDRRAPGGDASSLWTGDSDERELLWAFVEMQSKATCMNVVRPGVGPLLTMTGLEDGSFGLVGADRRMSRLRVVGGHALVETGVSLDPGTLVAAVVPSGAYVVTLVPGELRCVDVRRGEVLATASLPPGTGELTGVCASDWGASVTTPSGEVLVFGVPGLEPLYRADGLAGGQQAWLDPDSAHIGMLDPSSELLLVDLTSGRGERVGRALEQRPERSWPQVALDSDGRFGAISHGSGIELRGLAGAHHDLTALPRPGYRVQVAFNRSCTLLSARAFGDSRVRLWRTGSWEELEALPGHQGAVSLHAFSYDGTRLATSDVTGTLRVWATPEHGFRRAIGGPTPNAHELSITPDGATLFAPDATGAMGVYPALPDAQVANGAHGSLRIGGREAGDDSMTHVKSAVCEALGVVAVTPLIGDRIDVVPWGTGPDAPGVGSRTIRLGQGRNIAGIAFGPGSAVLGACTTDGEVFLVDASSGETLARTRVDPGGAPAALRFSPDAEEVGIALRDGRLVTLDARTLSVVRSVRASPEQLRSLAFVGDGRWIAGVGDAGRVVLVDRRTGRIRLSERISEDSLFSVAAHPAGRTLLVGDRAGRVLVVDTDTLGVLATLDAGGPVMSLLFSPDADTVFVAALDCAIERWDFGLLARTLPEVRPPSRARSHGVTPGAGPG